MGPNEVGRTFVYLLLLLLLVNSVGFGDWVKLLRLVLFTRVFFNLVVVASVVSMTFSNAVFIAD